MKLKAFKWFKLRRHTIAVLVAIVVAITMANIISVLSLKGDSRGVESNVIVVIERLLTDNSNLYPSPEKIPHSITQYSPIYYMISDLVVTISGYQPGKDSSRIRVIIRLLSLLFLIGILVFVNRIISLLLREKGFNRSVQIIISCLIVNVTFPWFIIARPDVLVSLIMVISIYFFFKGYHTNNLCYLGCVGAISVLAPLAKQNGLIIILIMGSYLLFTLEIKKLIVFLSSAIVSVLLFAVVFYFFGYSSAYLYDNLVIGVRNGIDLQAAWVNAYEPFLRNCWAGILFLIILCSYYFKKWRTDPRTKFLLYFLAINFSFSLVTALKYGSAENYFNDTILLMVILGASMVTFLGKKNRKWLYVSFIAATLLSSIQTYKKYTKNYYLTHENTDFENTLEVISETLHKELDGALFYTKIRRLNVRFPSNCIFPQSEIIESSLAHHTKSYEYYMNLVDGVDYSVIKFVIVYQQNSPLISLNHFTLYKTIGNVNMYINKEFL